MKKTNSFRFFAGPALVAALAVPLAGGCSSAEDAANAAKGCDGLDVSAKADLKIKAFAKAAGDLKAAALELEAKWAATCNAINKDLGLDDTKTDAAGACGVLNARVKTALDAGVTVTVEATYSCQAEASVTANCQAQCAAAANCDIAASCSPGELSGSCSAECSGSCTAPSVECTGECKGTCEASAGDLVLRLLHRHLRRAHLGRHLRSGL